MSWNMKPGSSALPPPTYPRKRSPFLEQPFRNPLSSTPQSSLTYPAQHPEACAFLGSTDLIAQPQLGHPKAQLRNYSASSVQSGAVVTSQTSYVSIKPRPVDHSAQVSPGLSHGTWLNSSLRNSALQHPAASAPPQNSFGTKAPAIVQALQNPFVTSDSYSMQLQVAPVSSSRAPVSCQGSLRVSPTPLQCFPGTWTQQPHTSSGLACPEYRPPQHTYPSSSFVQEPALQKPGSLPARNSLAAGSVLTVPHQQVVPGQPFQCTAMQPDSRVTAYSCNYTGQPLPNPQHVPKHVAAQQPQSQEPQTPDTRKEFRGGFQPIWPKLAENLSTLGTFCNVKIINNSAGEHFHGSTRASMPSETFHGPPRASIPGEPFHGPSRASMPGEPFHGPAGAAMPGEPVHGPTRASMPGEPLHGPTRASVPREPFHGPTRASVPGESLHEPSRVSMPGMQTVVPSRQEKRVTPCSLPPNSALDTNVTKEKLVRDIKTLVEIKNKFSELARKIKINKELLMAAGCIKTTNAPYSDSTPNPELAQKESGKVHSGSLLSLLTSGATENKELDRAGGRPSSPGAFGSDLHGALCPEMLPVSAQGQGQQAQTSQMPAVEGAQATGSSASCSSGSFASIDENAPASLDAPSAFPPQSPCEAKDKYLHKHPIILRLLEVGDHTTQEKLLKGTHEPLQDSRPSGPEGRPGAPGSSQMQWRAAEAMGACNTGTKDPDHTLLQDLPSPSNGAHSNSNSPCSMELLATCLSLWRNNPAEPARDMPREQPGTSSAASGPCSNSGLMAETSGSTAAAIPQDSALTVASQSHETPGMALSKGMELQVAVVTPLILANAKPLAVKGDAPEMVYPVIKEGSVCSLQSRLAEEAGAPAALKASVEGPVAAPAPHTTSTEDWAQGNPEGTSRLCPGQQIQAEPGESLPRGRERTSENKLQIGSICSLVEGAMSYNPQIAEIFSVSVQPELGDSHAEDRGMGAQIQASVRDVALSGKTTQKSTVPQLLGPHPPEPEPTSLCPPEPALPQPPDPPHPVDGHSAATQASGLGCPMESSGLTLNLDPATAAQDRPCEDIVPGSMETRTLEDETPISYLDDQLLELLEEFPYGVVPVSTCEAPASWHLPGRGQKRPRTPEPVSAAAAKAGQIQITILNAEQMKALFPEQDLREPDIKLESQKAELVCKEGTPPVVGGEEGAQQGPQAQVTEDESQGDPPAQVSEGNPGNLPAQISEESRGDARTSEEGCEQGPQISEEERPGDLPAQVNQEERSEDSPLQVSEEASWGDVPVQVTEKGSRVNCPVQASEEGSQGDPLKNRTVDPQKDDLPCCALGWLSAVYEGVPQCQCNLAKGHRKTKPKRKSKHPQPSQDTPAHKQGESSMGRGGPHHHVPLVRPDRKRPIPGSGTKDRAKVKRSDPRKTQQALSGQHSHSVPRPTEPVSSQARPSGGKLHASEVIVPKSSKPARSPPEDQPRKQPVPSPQLLKAKVGFLSHKTKELHRSLGPRKLLLKAGVASHKAWDKRKSETGGALDSAVKRRKVDKPEPSRAEGPAGGTGGGSAGKPWGSSSLSKEGSHGKDRLGPQLKAVGTGDGSPKAQRPVFPGSTHRHKHKETATAKTSKKDPGKAKQRHKQVLRLHKSGQVQPRPSSSRPAPEDASRAGASFVKSPQPCTEESKAQSSRPEKQAGRKSRERPWVEKSQSHRHSGSAGLTAAPDRDHKKLYLNRVGFQCTERQSICLTQLDPLPQKPHKKPREDSCPRQEDVGRPGMLEFKLCPESMIPKAGLGSEHARLQPGPQKEQEPAQVSGIRSTKEDWLKRVTEERRPDATQGTDSKAVGNPRLSRRALSADGTVGAQAPPKDFQAMFQTYRKMYMEKRSRSLGSSPLK